MCKEHTKRGIHMDIDNERKSAMSELDTLGENVFNIINHLNSPGLIDVLFTDASYVSLDIVNEVISNYKQNMRERISLSFPPIMAMVDKLEHSMVTALVDKDKKAEAEHKKTAVSFNKKLDDQKVLSIKVVAGLEQELKEAKAEISKLKKELKAIANIPEPEPDSVPRVSKMLRKKVVDPTKKIGVRQLTCKQIKAIIKASVKDGIKYITLSKKYGVSQTSISRIVNKKTYKKCN